MLAFFPWNVLGLLALTVLALFNLYRSARRIGSPASRNRWFVLYMSAVGMWLCFQPSLLALACGLFALANAAWFAHKPGVGPDL